MKRITYILICLFAFVSCDYFTKKDVKDAIARVNNNYLYIEDVEGLLTEGMSPDDSALVVNNYINRWATQQLLIAGAEFNLPQDKKQEFDKLVDQYRIDLFTKAYMEALVKKNLNEEVSLEEAEEFYNNNTNTFKLNEELIKFRYIKIDENRTDFDEIKTRFQRFNDEDKFLLDSISIQFNSYSLNDSIWIKLNQAIDKIPVINQENKDELLKKSNFIQLKDSLGVYLMKINDVLLRNQNAPLEYVKPTIDQIVINKRKLELIRELEKDITTDAIKNRQLEIYN